MLYSCRESENQQTSILLSADSRVLLYGKNMEGKKKQKTSPLLCLTSVWRQQGKVPPGSFEVHTRNLQSSVWDFLHTAFCLFWFSSLVQRDTWSLAYTLLNDLPMEITAQRSIRSYLQVPVSCPVLSCLLSCLILSLTFPKSNACEMSLFSFLHNFEQSGI